MFDCRFLFQPDGRMAKQQLLGIYFIKPCGPGRAQRELALLNLLCSSDRKWIGRNFPTLMEVLDSCPADNFPNMNSLLRAVIKLTHPAAFTDFSPQQTVSKGPEIIHTD